MTKTTMTTKAAAKGTKSTAAAAATVVVATAAALYQEFAAQLDNAGVRSLVASVLGLDAVGPDTNASWYRWNAKRQATARRG